MEQIEQLKAMRDAARARIEALPDHRLMTSLSALIEDLELAFGGRQTAAPREAAAPAAAAHDGNSAHQDDAMEEPGQFQAADFATPYQSAHQSPDQAPDQMQASRSVFDEPVESEAQPEQVEETVVIIETAEDIDADDIELLIAPEEIENLIAAEVVSMNGSANGSHGMAQSEEEAVNRALDELSIDLADTLGSEPAGYTRS